MSTGASLILLAGRMLFAALFLHSARGHLQNHSRFVGSAKGRLPIPYAAGWPVGVWLLLGDLSVVLGLWEDIGALMLAAFVLPAALLFHPFWTFTEAAQRRTQEGSFYRNLSLLGAALVLFVLFGLAGAGQFALTGPLVRLR